MEKRLIVGHYGWFGLKGDAKTHLNKLRDNRATGIRVFGQFAWPDGRGTFTPFANLKNIKKIEKYQWNPPAAGEEYRKDRYFKAGEWVMFRHRQYSPPILPVYDLDVITNEYKERVEELFQYCADIGLSIEPFELEDFCSLKHAGIDKYRHPYFVSPQAHSAHTPGGLYGDALFKYMTKYWNTVFKIALKTKVNIKFSIMNEYNWSGHKADGTQYTEEEQKWLMLAWYSKACIYHDKIMNENLGRIPSYEIISSAMRHHYAISGITDSYSIHGIGDKPSFEHNIKLLADSGMPWQNEGSRIYLSSDGFSDGSGKPDFKGRRGIGIAEVPYLCRMVNKYDFKGLELLIRYRQGHANGYFEDFGAKYDGYTIIKKAADGLHLPPAPVLPTPPVPPLPPPPEKPIETPKPPSQRIPCFQKIVKGLGNFFKKVLDKSPET